MSSLILVGAGRKTRLVLDFLRTEGRAEIVAGIVDANADKMEASFCGRPILGNIEAALKIESNPPLSFCICLGETYFRDREWMQHEIDRLGRSAEPVISTLAMVSISASVAHGSLIFPGACIDAFATVGRCVTIYPGTYVGHDCEIKDNVEISPRACLAGSVIVHSDTFIGMNATILPHVRVGRNAVVGAGAVVTKDVSDDCVVAGNPARLLRRVPATERTKTSLSDFEKTSTLRI
jgi:sugar O-acyltransferase (sialic acid O-acetyltransferase NeuD family)